MDLFLLILSLLCMIIGIIGSLLPMIPGVFLSWVGLFLLYCTQAVPINYWVLGITLAIVIIISFLEYIIPAKGTKKFGGSSYGIWGTNIGLVIGILAPIPFGFLIGPFLAPFLGEIIYDAKDQQRAFRAATGSFIGFLVSTFLNFMLSIVFLGWFIKLVWQYHKVLF